MRCPFCPTVESKVIDSRVSKDGAIIRRRRECEVCGKRFTTYERVEEPLPAVVKKDGRREAFDRMKIVGGVKRPARNALSPWRRSTRWLTISNGGSRSRGMLRCQVPS